MFVDKAVVIRTGSLVEKKKGKKSPTIEQTKSDLAVEFINNVPIFRKLQTAHRFGHEGKLI